MSRPVFLRMAFSIASLFLKRSVDSLVITTILRGRRRAAAAAPPARVWQARLVTVGGSQGGFRLASKCRRAAGTGLCTPGGVWARLRVHAASVSSCEALPQERTGCLDRQHRRHVREQVSPRVRIEATERGLGERVVEVEGGDLRGRCRREVRPHEERAANDAPSGRDLDAAQGCAHVALALAPQCGARLQLILTVAELYHIQRRTAAGTGSPSQSSWCDQSRGMGRMAVLAGRADKGRERALEHALLRAVFAGCRTSSGKSSQATRRRCVGVRVVRASWGRKRVPHKFDHIGRKMRTQSAD